jgi:hypothetical protein
MGEDALRTRIKGKVAELLGMPMLDKDFEMHKCRLASPLDWYLRQDSVWRDDPSRCSNPSKYDLGPVRSELCQLLRRVLGHIAANPSKPGNVEALRRTYVIPQKAPMRTWEYYKVARCDCLNESEVTIRDFVIKLARIAQIHRELHVATFHGVSQPRDLSTEDIDLGGRSKWVLLGDKGMGKTIFLNFMLGVFTPQLHSSKVIWIRVDYTKTTTPELNLEDLIRWQFCEVLFKYYDSESMEIDRETKGVDSPAFEHWKDKTIHNMVFDLGPSNNKLFQCAQHIDRSLKREEFEETLRRERAEIKSRKEPCRVTSWLFEGIRDYLMVDRKVGFIVIIDGLDQLGLSVEQEELFKNKIAQINALVRPESAEHWAYLVTMRHESYWTYFVDYEFRRIFQPAVLEMAPSIDIWNRKIRYLQDRQVFYSGDYENIFKMDANIYRDSIEELANIFLKFVTYSLRLTLADDEVTKGVTDLNDIPVEEGFQILEKIFHTNRRLMFESLVRIADFFINRLPGSFDRMLDHLMAEEAAYVMKKGTSYIFDESTFRDIRRWSYLVIEALMLGQLGLEFRGRQRDYQPVFVSGSEPTFKRISGGGGEYLLNVFEYPYTKSDEQYLSILCATRAIQYAHLIGSVIKVPELIRFLQTYFNYPINIIQTLIDELTYGGIFRVESPGIGTLSSEIELTRRGEFVLNRLLNALEYISMAVQAAPLPVELVMKGTFQIRPYTSYEFVIDNKVVSSINLVRLLSDVEMREQSYFDQQLKRPKGDTRQNYRSFKGYDLMITDRMRRYVQRSIFRIIDRAFDTKQRVLIRQFENRFFEDLERYFGTQAC